MNCMRLTHSTFIALHTPGIFERLVGPVSSVMTVCPPTFASAITNGSAWNFFLSRRHQASICVHDAINLALYRFIWHKEHRLAWLEPCVKFFRALFAAFTQYQR